MKTANRVLGVIPSIARNLLFALAFLLLSANPASAQVATGTPTFGSFSGGPEIINNGNLNAHWTIPVLHKPGRGTNFDYDIVYDSSVWTPVASGSTKTWVPNNNWGWFGSSAFSSALAGYVTYYYSSTYCYDQMGHPNGADVLYDSYVYHDPWGINHSFSGMYEVKTGGCGSSTTNTFPSGANDASGYLIQGTQGPLFAKDGTNVGAPFNPGGGSYASSKTDRNGNQLTQDSSGHFYDTTSSTAAVLSVSGTAPNPVTFTYTAPSGATPNVKMVYSTYTVHTAFACSNVTDYPATSVNLVSEIDLPDGSKYLFDYENTPNDTHSPHYRTGRLAKVTLPTGGTVTYTYTGGNNGITCADGSTSGLQRQTPDSGSNYWNYVRTQVSGNEWKTTVTTPPDPTNSPAAGNDTVIYFQKDFSITTNNFYETQRKAYQGSSTSGTLLQTVDTCYNTATAPCTTATVSSPITQRDVLPSIPSAGSVTVQAKHTTKYNSVGMPIEFDDYPFGSGTFGGLLRQTLVTYASLPPNITAFRQTVTVKNGSGTVLAQTNYNYDQTTPVNAPTGTPQLTSVSGSRGNLTSVQRCTNLANCSTSLQTTMTYDTAGQPQTVRDPLNNQTSFSYSDNFLDDDGSNPPSKAHTLTYPTDAYVTSITPPLNGAITMKYYFYNARAASTTDQNGNNSWSHFDSIGRPSSTYGPSLPIAGSPSPGNANPWTLVNYTSPTQIDTYSDINDTSTTAVSTCTVCRQDEVKVDGLGRAINSYLKSDPEGQTEVDTVYDALGRVKTGSHPYRSTNDTTYGIETPTYDALGRTIKVTHADNTYSQAAFGAGVSGTGVKTSQVCSSTSYGLGYPSLFTDESGKMREIWTDALGRTIEADEPDSTSALNSNTCYSYDPLGNLLQIVHGSQTRTYGYDTLSRVNSVSIPELANCAVTYGYDNDSNVQTRTAPAPNQTSCSTTVTTTYSHDALNRLTKIAYGATTPIATPTVQYVYDGATPPTGCSPPSLTDNNPKGRMTAMCDGSGATSWAHDAAGRIITEKRTIRGTSAVTQTISYSYNLDSSIATVTYPSGKTVTYTVSNAQRLTAANDTANSVLFATAASYSAPGGLSGVITGQISGFSGISETHNYNKSLEYTSTKATSTAGTAMDLTVNYASSGDNGSITSITNNVDNGRNQTFSYDSLNRILSASSSATTGADCWGQVFGPDGSFADDAVANLTKVNSGTQSPPPCTVGYLSATVDANNHINTDSTYAYDAAGNMTKDGTGASYSYAFDAENRLVQANGFTGSPWCYVYDGKGLRVAKKSGAASDCTGGSIVQLYWRSLSGNALAETDGSGNTLNEYVFFAGRRVASRNGSGAIFYYFADQVGSTRSITTGSGIGQTPGQLCYDADFTPYGQEISYTARLQTTACPQNYKFTGYERDAETGLDYAFNRYYSSRLGRFLSIDPLGGAVGNLQSNNAYAYTQNNPLNFSDPSGLCRERKDDSCRDERDCDGCRFAGLFGFGGPDSWLGNSGCTVDGSPMPCGFVGHLLSTGVAAICLNNDCTGLTLGADGNFTREVQITLSFWFTGAQSCQPSDELEGTSSTCEFGPISIGLHSWETVTVGAADNNSILAFAGPPPPRGGPPNSGPYFKPNSGPPEPSQPYWPTEEAPKIITEDPENYVPPNPEDLSVWQKTKYVILKIFQAFGQGDLFIITTTCPDGSMPSMINHGKCPPTI